MSFKVEVEDVFPDALARGARFELEQVDVVSGQHAEAFVQRAGLVGSCHDQHGFRLAIGARSRFAAQDDETGIVVFDGLNAFRQDFQLVEFSRARACHSGHALQVFFANHFRAACRIVGGDDFHAKFAQVDIALRQRLRVRDDSFDVAELLSRQAEQAVIDGMTDFACYEQVVLAQEIIDIIDAAGLRIFNGYQAKFDLSGGNSAEHVGECAIWHWLRSRSSLLCIRQVAKVDTDGFVAERAALALKGDAQS